MMATDRPNIFLALNAAVGETENDPNTFQGSAEEDSRFLSNAVKCKSAWPHDVRGRVVRFILL